MFPRCPVDGDTVDVVVVVDEDVVALASTAEVAKVEEDKEVVKVVVLPL